MESSIRDSSDDDTMESSLPLRERTRLRAAPTSVSPLKARRQKPKRHAEAELRDNSKETVDRPRRRSRLPVSATKETEMSTDDDDVPRDESGSSEPPADPKDQLESPESESQDEGPESPQKSRVEGDDPESEDDQPDEPNEGESHSPSMSKNLEIEEATDDDLPKSKKKRIPGIVYLSYIPDGLTVAKTRELLGEFGEVKRMYFEPVKKLSAKIRPLHRFREGWVEFGKKKDAKRVAELLNAKPVGGKRRAPYRDSLWSIKYLNRFRWTHLAERLTYEKAVKDQRMRTEIAKAKREAKFYAKTLEQSIRRRKQRQAGDISEDNPSRIKLRKTDREIREEKSEPAPNEIADKGLLMSIFAKD